MLILWRLLFGHFLADFTLQTNFINAWKRSSKWGMMAHCAIHPVCYFALTAPFIDDYWVLNPLFQLKGWACILIVFLAHYIEDEWRVFTIFRYKTPDNTLYFIWDQVIHYAVIFAVIPLGQIGDPAFALIPEKWPVLGCLAVLATHATTVLVYFIEKDLYEKEFPELWEKYLGMAERLVLALSCMLPEFWWIPAAGSWAGAMYALRSRRMLDLSWLGYYVGCVAALACGLAARWVYYY